MIPYTHEELRALKATRLDELIKFAGTKAHLARMLSVNPNTVEGWSARGAISKLAVDRIEENPAFNKTKFTKEYLRPDL